MINLIDYFDKNDKNEFWLNKKNEILYVFLNQQDVEFYDDEQIIEKFKELLDPRVVEQKYYFKENDLFLLICFYLQNNGYVIMKFPNALSKPKNLFEFGNTKIINYLKKQGFSKNGIVEWSTRRAFVDELEIVKTNIEINVNLDEGLKKLISDIPTIINLDDIDLCNKIRKIYMILELLTKKENGNYVDIDFNDIFLETISEEQYKKYKQYLNNFRHCNINKQNDMESIRKLSNEDLVFICNFGYTIINKLYHSRSKCYEKNM